MGRGRIGRWNGSDETELGDGVALLAELRDARIDAAAGAEVLLGRVPEGGDILELALMARFEGLDDQGEAVGAVVPVLGADA